MNDALFNRWLFESESDSIDFKREQYRFIGATAIEKSELLKDILAMANSWRRTDGYIVLGIEDKPDKPNTFHGITDHIDDAALQQFVNGKVSGLCSFEYRTFSRDSKTIGIIRVSVQKRPVYLSKDYGKLKANVVYVRRGSSTSEARPDEVSMMGKDQDDLVVRPLVEIGYYDDSKGKLIGTETSYETTYVVITDDIPDYHSPGNGIYSFNVTDQRDYFRDFAEFVNFKYSYIPLRFAVTNKGEKEAVNLRAELTISIKDASILLDGSEIPEPDKNSTVAFASRLPFRPSAFSADLKEDGWLISNSIDRLHAKRTLEFDGTVYLQVKESSSIKLSASLFFDGQPEPHKQELTLDVNCNRHELPWKTFYEKLIASDAT